MWHYEHDDKIIYPKFWHHPKTGRVVNIPSERGHHTHTISASPHLLDLRRPEVDAVIHKHGVGTFNEHLLKLAHDKGWVRGHANADEWNLDAKRFDDALQTAHELHHKYKALPGGLNIDADDRKVSVDKEGAKDVLGESFDSLSESDLPEIHVSPTAKQLGRIIKRSKARAVRGFVDDKHSYWWDAHEAPHDRFISKLNMTDWYDKRAWATHDTDTGFRAAYRGKEPHGVKLIQDLEGLNQREESFDSLLEGMVHKFPGVNEPYWSNPMPECLRDYRDQALDEKFYFPRFLKKLSINHPKLRLMGASRYPRTFRNIDRVVPRVHSMAYQKAKSSVDIAAETAYGYGDVANKKGVGHAGHELASEKHVIAMKEHQKAEKAASRAGDHDAADFHEFVANSHKQDAAAHRLKAAATTKPNAKDLNHTKQADDASYRANYGHAKGDKPHPVAGTVRGHVEAIKFHKKAASYFGQTPYLQQRNKQLAQAHQFHSQAHVNSLHAVKNRLDAMGQAARNATIAVNKSRSDTDLHRKAFNLHVMASKAYRQNGYGQLAKSHAGTALQHKRFITTQKPTGYGQTESFDVSEAIDTSDHLSLDHRFFDASDTMHPEVRKVLLKVCNDIEEDINRKGIEFHPKEMVISGSLTGPDWDEKSDIDTDMSVDYSVYKEPDLARQFFSQYAQLFNEKNFQLLGRQIEIYFPTEGDPHYSPGLYDLKNNKWIHKDTEFAQPPTEKQQSMAAHVRKKAQALIERHSGKDRNPEAAKREIENFFNSLRDKRTESLHSKGLHADWNIAYKLVHRDGTLDKLRSLIDHEQQEIYSVPSVSEVMEGFDVEESFDSLSERVQRFPDDHDSYWMNPTPDEAKHLHSRFPLRGLVGDDGHMYVWNGLKHTHYHFQKKTGVVEHPGTRFEVKDNTFDSSERAATEHLKLKPLLSVFKNSVNESHIPASTYGYWISPDGKYHNVSHSHNHAALPHLRALKDAGGEFPYYDDHTEKLLSKHKWVRVAGHLNSPDLGIALPDTTTVHQHKALLPLVDYHIGRNRPVFLQKDTPSEVSKANHAKIDAGTSPAEAKRIMRQYLPENFDSMSLGEKREKVHGLSDVESKVIDVCKPFSKRDPDYGTVFWHPEKKHVHYVQGDAADYHCRDVKAAISKVSGVQGVTIGDEYSPKRNEGWRQIYPKVRPWVDVEKKTESLRSYRDSVIETYEGDLRDFGIDSSQKELRKRLYKSKYKALRGQIHGDHVYWFDAGHGTHDDFYHHVLGGKMYDSDKKDSLFLRLKDGNPSLQGNPGPTPEQVRRYGPNHPDITPRTNWDHPKLQHLKDWVTEEPRREALEPAPRDVAEGKMHFHQTGRFMKTMRSLGKMKHRETNLRKMVGHMKPRVGMLHDKPGGALRKKFGESFGEMGPEGDSYYAIGHGKGLTTLYAVHSGKVHTVEDPGGRSVHGDHFDLNNVHAWGRADHSREVVSLVYQNRLHPRRQEKILKQVEAHWPDYSVEEFHDPRSRMENVESEEPYPLAGTHTSGLEVRKDIPNTSSIRASFNEDEYHTLPGIREVPIEHFDADPKHNYYAANDHKHIDRLSQQISQSKQINPLIVVHGEKAGPYVLEGGHRLGALHKMGIKTFPALVVHSHLDESEEFKAGEKYDPKEMAVNPSRKEMQHRLRSGQHRFVIKDGVVRVGNSRHFIHRHLALLGKDTSGNTPPGVEAEGTIGLSTQGYPIVGVQYARNSDMKHVEEHPIIKSWGIPIHKQANFMESEGENCPHCGASMERGDNGHCNRCGKPWSKHKVSDSVSQLVRYRNNMCEKREEVDGIEYHVNPNAEQLHGYVKRVGHARGVVDDKGDHYWFNGYDATHDEFGRRVLKTDWLKMHHNPYMELASAKGSGGGAPYASIDSTVSERFPHVSSIVDDVYSRLRIGHRKQKGVKESEDEGSRNFETRVQQGWVQGNARYADEEPHHMRDEYNSWNYVSMHHAGREAQLTGILHGTREGKTKAHVRWSKERGYRLVRSVSGVTDEVPIPEEKIAEFSSSHENKGNHDDYAARAEKTPWDSLIKTSLVPVRGVFERMSSDHDERIGVTYYTNPFSRGDARPRTQSSLRRTGGKEAEKKNPVLNRYASETRQAGGNVRYRSRFDEDLDEHERESYFSVGHDQFHKDGDVELWAHANGHLHRRKLTTEEGPWSEDHQTVFDLENHPEIHAWGRVDHPKKKVSVVFLPETSDRKREYVHNQIDKTFPGYSHVGGLKRVPALETSLRDYRDSLV